MITGMWFSKRVSTSEHNNIPYLKGSRRCGDLLAPDQKKSTEDVGKTTGSLTINCLGDYL